MPNLTEKTQVQNYFNDIIQKEKGIKIKTVFSLDYSSWDYCRGHRVYMQDSNLYMMFEDMNCLIIRFLGIDMFDVEYRKLTKKERAIYNENRTEDHFNKEDALHDSFSLEKIETQFCFLDYGCLKGIETFPATHPYEKWVNSKIRDCEPTSETFYRIKLLMDNGKSINIEAEPAIYDAYMDVWSEDTVEFRIPVR